MGGHCGHQSTTTVQIKDCLRENNRGLSTKWRSKGATSIIRRFEAACCDLFICYTNLFKVDWETGPTTYINHSQRLIPDGIHG